MNARQRRTERRRREREIKTIVEHVEGMQAEGNGLDGEDRRVFEFQLSEVQTLMSQVQHQQQDNGEGALIEYHLRKLRSLIKLEEPQPEGEEGEEVTPGTAVVGTSTASSTPASQHTDTGVGSALASAFQEQMRLVTSGGEGTPEGTGRGFQTGGHLLSSPETGDVTPMPSTA